MSGLIDREKLLEALNDAPEYVYNLPKLSQDIYDTVMRDVVVTVKNAQAVDVEPVRHGHWILVNPDEPELPVYECSECERIGAIKSRLKYCSNCGAKMDGGDKMLPEFSAQTYKQARLEWFEEQYEAAIRKMHYWAKRADGYLDEATQRAADYGAQASYLSGAINALRKEDWLCLSQSETTK